MDTTKFTNNDDHASKTTANITMFNAAKRAASQSPRPVHIGARLVPIFCANETDAAQSLSLSICHALAQTAASHGETVLMLDIAGGTLMEKAGIITGTSLGDVLHRNGQLRDAKYIDKNEHFTAANAGDASLEDLLGSIAALSLNYDWVFVAVEAGCTPAHVRLAAAADGAVMNFMSTGDQFMRAYWMMDAIRARAPKFDPLMLVHGPQAESFEAYDMFSATIGEFLGAAPALGGIVEPHDQSSSLAAVLLSAMRVEADVTALKRARP